MPSDNDLKIRPAVKDDLPSIASIGSEAFSGLRPLDRGMSWVNSCFAAGPRMVYWVAESSRGILGYILWNEKGGFRERAVIELEQIAVSKKVRSQGIGRKLILESLKGVEQALESRGSKLKLIEVTTGSEQNALEFYRHVLKAEVAAKIPDYFRGDEFVLLSRRNKGGT